MKNYALLFILSLLIEGSFSYPVAAGMQDAHSGHASLEIALDHGKKWPIDSSLHKGMTDIKTLMSTNLTAIHLNSFSNQQYGTLAKTLHVKLTYILENCALPPAADGQLHILLSGIMQGMEQMEEGTEKRQGAVQVLRGLEIYPKYFDDPDWENIKH